jgi:hypothetical protein
MKILIDIYEELVLGEESLKSCILIEKEPVGPMTAYIAMLLRSCH